MSGAAVQGATPVMKIRLVMLGKTRREEIRALSGRLRRAHPPLRRNRGHRNPRGSPAALRKLKMEPGATLVLLDAGGNQFTSQQFARWLGGLRDHAAREIVFLCGDAEGFPIELRSLATQRISLSTLTMPHEFARVVLAEQIYRAFAILAGHPYPK